MTYSQHCNHLAAGLLLDNCYYCQFLIIQPAQREKRGEYRKSPGDAYPINLDELDQLAFEEAA